jgi:hypothetical protein
MPNAPEYPRPGFVKPAPPSAPPAGAFRVPVYVNGQVVGYATGVVTGGKATADLHMNEVADPTARRLQIVAKEIADTFAEEAKLDEQRAAIIARRRELQDEQARLQDAEYLARPSV